MLVLFIQFVRTIFSKKFLFLWGIILAIFLALYFGRKGYIHFFKKPSSETKVVILEIRKISQLLTCSYYDECVSELKRKGSVDPYYVIIARGTVKTGFDLSGLDPAKSIIVQGNTLTIRLNPPRIMDVIVLPSGIEPFIWKGTITQEDRVLAQKNAIEIIRRSALDKGILQLSESQVKNILTKFFTSIGFDQVTVEISDAS
jgi:hypothetical protein